MKIGDVVKTPIHQYKMTIYKIRGEIVTCSWFDDQNQLHQEGFGIHELELV